MSKAQEDRAREKFADKMRQKTAKAKADLAARQAGKSSAGKTATQDEPKP
jgi:hypothetical protein